MKNIGLVLLFFWQVGFGQTTFPGIGTKWWYDNNQSQRVLPSGIYDTRIGYIKYECTKDTTVNAETVRLIKVNNHSYTGTVTALPSILIKQTNQLIEYKYLGDTQWYFFNLLNPVNNQTFTGYLKNSVTSLKTFSISGVGVFTVDGLTITYYSLHFNDNNWSQKSLQYTNIGSPINFTIYSYNPVADDFLSEVPFVTTLRCFEKDYSLHKFQLSRLAFVSPTSSGISSYNCDSIKYQLVTKVEREGKKNHFNIFPNPVENELFFDEILQNSTVKNVEIFTLEGILIKKYQLSENSINVSNLQKGMYFISFTIENQKFIYKFYKY